MAPGGIQTRSMMSSKGPMATGDREGMTGSLRKRPSTAPVRRRGQESKEDGGGGGGGNIRVFVRVRPLSTREREETKAFACCEAVNDKEVHVHEFCATNDYLRAQRLKTRRFAFDSVFGPDSDQPQVFKDSTAPLVEAVLRGENACCFCYGATGAGKTHTMLGTESQPGVMVLALQQLFNGLNDGTYVSGEVMLSYLEIYNETVRDLLDTSMSAKQLKLREDPIAGVVVQGLTKVKATSAKEVMSLLQCGNRRRTTESTRSNETSSRSHAVLQVVVTMNDGSYTRRGKISLIDLAGSERTLATEEKKKGRSVEGANINKSLLALSGCISSLVAGKRHIPYRNSKLTQLLKDSLGGRCQTAMIANLSPSHHVLSESSNTLHWADRAKQIRVQHVPAVPVRNVVPSSGPNDHNNGRLGAMLAENEDAMRIAQLEQRNREMSKKIAELERGQKRPQSAMPLGRDSAARTVLPRHGSSKDDSRKRKPSVTSGSDEMQREIMRLRQSISSKDAQYKECEKRSRMARRQFEADIDQLKREYELKVKHKDDFIRQLTAQSARVRERAVAAVRSESTHHQQQQQQQENATCSTPMTDAKSAAVDSGPSMSQLMVRLSSLQKQGQRSAGVKRPFGDLSNNLTPPTSPMVQ